MPQRNDQYDENEAMSIPISPTKKHPSGRQPLQLSNPLPWLEQGYYVRTLLTERQVRISSVRRKKTSSTPQTPRSGSSSSTTTLANSVAMVPETHLRNLMTLCDADQRKARAPEIVMPRSDSDSELARAHTHESADRDSWIEDAEFHAPNRLFLSFDVWLDLTVCPQLPEPSGVRKELEQLYMYVACSPLASGGNCVVANQPLGRPFSDVKRKTPVDRRGATDGQGALTRAQVQSPPLTLWYRNVSITTRNDHQGHEVSCEFSACRRLMYRADVCLERGLLSRILRGCLCHGP